MKNLSDELKYFQKKYSFEVKILSNDQFIIPEYKIDLINKTKKIINTLKISIQYSKLRKKQVLKKKKKERNKEKN